MGTHMSIDIECGYATRAGDGTQPTWTGDPQVFTLSALGIERMDKKERGKKGRRRRRRARRREKGKEKKYIKI